MNYNIYCLFCNQKIECPEVNYFHTIHCIECNAYLHAQGDEIYSSTFKINIDIFEYSIDYFGYKTTVVKKQWLIDKKQYIPYKKVLEINSREIILTPQNVKQKLPILITFS